MKSVIRDVPILDLRDIPPEAFARLERIEVVRTVVLSSKNAEAFMRISRLGVRSHLIVDPDETLFVGQIEIGDQFLSSLQDDSKCVILGHPFLDCFSIPLFLAKVRSIRVYGQVLYSQRALAGTLLSRLVRLQGQLLRMPPDALRWIGPTLLDHTRLGSIDRRGIVSIGTITIDPQVSSREIMDSVSQMPQIGEVIGTEEGVSALLSRCAARVGMYRLVAPNRQSRDLDPSSDASIGSPLVHIQGSGATV